MADDRVLAALAEVVSPAGGLSQPLQTIETSGEATLDLTEGAAFVVRPTGALTIHPPRPSVSSRKLEMTVVATGDVTFGPGFRLYSPAPALAAGEVAVGRFVTVDGLNWIGDVSSVALLPAVEGSVDMGVSMGGEMSLLQPPPASLIHGLPTYIMGTSGSYEVGWRFTPVVDLTMEAFQLLLINDPANVGVTRTCRLWNYDTQALLAGPSSVPVEGEGGVVESSASEQFDLPWGELALDAPVALAAGTTYALSITASGQPIINAQWSNFTGPGEENYVRTDLITIPASNPGLYGATQGAFPATTQPSLYGLVSAAVYPA